MTRSQLRQRTAAMIEELIDLLDQLDGDPDDELETDLDINPVSLQSVERRPVRHITQRAA
ncbi:hypothetical protein N8D56_04845 [Devosia sp. A8/3-2]|nr:hypothetical protein N8D56_04845 [Devosia sp. A8/3-2]